MNRDSYSHLDQFTRVVVMAAEDAPNGTRSYQVAGAGARFLAGAVDFLIQIVLFIVMAWTAVRAWPDLFPRESWPWAIPVAFVEWHIIYMMLFESFARGITPGKSLFRIKVVTVEGALPGARALVVRNVLRLIDIILGGYAGSFIMINLSELRQRIGDRYGNTLVVYSTPLTGQLRLADVPESIYSTSEDGYLLQAWVEREKRLDVDSQMASAIDLAAYLHSKYDPAKRDLPDPATYLRQLYEVEHEHHHGVDAADAK